jgi:hypothetical protein
MIENRELAKDLFLTFERGATFYTAQLFRLIAKADGHNKERLSLVFPDHVAMYLEWMGSPTADMFYKRYDIAPLIKDEDGNTEKPCEDEGRAVVAAALRDIARRIETDDTLAPTYEATQPMAVASRDGDKTTFKKDGPVVYKITMHRKEEKDEQKGLERDTSSCGSDS